MHVYVGIHAYVCVSMCVHVCVHVCVLGKEEMSELPLVPGYVLSVAAAQRHNLAAWASFVGATAASAQ